MKLQHYIGIIALLGSSLVAQNYSWPTDNGRRLSSNFGEFRDDHFHMGLDISTYGVTGKPIRAVADGYVYKISASFKGYGKALYLRLNDDRTAVYGHLHQLSPLLEEVLKNQQQKNNSYNVQLQFQPLEFPVRRDEIIGYSGNTGGSMAAHLHFELRDSNDVTLNPQRNGFPLTDKLSPVIEALEITPLQPGTLIDASPLPRTFPTFRDISGVYHLPDTINCIGEIGLSLKTHDRIQGIRFKYNVYRIRLILDGSVFFQTQYDSLFYDQEALVKNTENHRRQRLFNEDYQQLFSNPENPPISVHNQTLTGRIKLTPGHHALQIEVSDAAGNKSLLKGTIFSLPPVKLKAQLVDQNESYLTFRVEPEGTLIPITSATCYSFTPFGYADQQVTPLKIKKLDLGLELTIARKAANNRILHFYGNNKMGAATYPFHWDKLTVAKDAYQTNFELEISQVNAGIFLQVKTSEYTRLQPRIALRSPLNDRPVPMTRVQPNVFLSEMLAPMVLSTISDIIIQIDDIPPREIRIPYQGSVALPGKSTAIVADDRKCSLQLLPTSFYDTTAVWIETVAEPIPIPEGVRLSQIYRLLPFDIPIRDSIRVAIRYDEKYQNLDRSALYYLNSKKEWKSLPTAHNQQRQTMIAKLSAMETVAILQDTTPPAIISTFPAQGGHYHYQDVETLKAEFADQLSGIEASEANLFLMLDGELQIFAYQPMLKEMSYTLDVPLNTGSHEIIFSVTDRAGNNTVKKIDFTVN